MNDPKQLAATPESLVPVPYFPKIDPFPANHAHASLSMEADGVSESKGSLTSYWRVLIRNKWKIIGATAGGAVLGILLCVGMKPIYSAYSTVEVLSMNEDFMNMKQSRLVTESWSDDVSEEQTESQLFYGDALLQSVSDKLNPNPTPSRAEKSASVWPTWLYGVQRHQTSTEELLAAAVASLDVRVLPRTRLIQVTANSADPTFAARFVSALVDEFVKQNVEENLNTAQSTSGWLATGVSETRADLQRSEDALQGYARRSGLLFTGSDQQQTTVVSDQVQQIERALSAATADRIAKQSRYEIAVNSPPNSLADVLNDPGLQALSAKINDAERHVAELTAVYNPDYSKVKSAKAEYESLQGALQKERADIVGRIQTDYEQAEGNEKLLAKTYLAAERELAGQDEKAVQYNMLKREVDSNRLLYDAMLQQTKQASLASALHAATVRVVDPARVADNPVSPKKALNLALATCLGLFGSTFLLILRERMDRTVQVPGDVNRWTGLRELGTIPMTTMGRKSQPPSFLRPSKTSIELVSSTDKSCLITEAFRSTLASIQFPGENSSSPRLLVVTSGQAGDGKTTVASNIGIALAGINCKTLIIDADLRCPRMHKVFDLSNDMGLSNLLQNGLREQDLRRAIQKTKVPGLDVLTAGISPADAFYLLHSPHLADLLRKVRLEYGIVLIDTPPLLYMSDARVIARSADATILVVGAGKTTRDGLLAARQCLEEDRIRVMGSILNNWDPSRTTDPGYKQYQRYMRRAVSLGATAA